MAKKVVRSNKKKGIKAKSQKDNKFKKFKLLSKTIVSGGNEHLYNALMQVDKKDLQNFKYRSIAQLLMYPKIISYINKYMNNKYVFGSMSPEDWFYTIMVICKSMGITNTSQLYYSRYQPNERDNFIKLIISYNTEIGNMPLNNAELNSLFILYKHGIITDEYLSDIKDILSGKVNTANDPKSNVNQFNIHQDLVNGNVTPVEDGKRTIESLSSDIQLFVSNINGYINARSVCKQCELNTRKAVTIDTNMQTIGPADIIFIGFNPSVEDVKNKLPFSGGPESILFHRVLQPLVKKYNLKYVLANFILCPTALNGQFKSKRKVIQNCDQILTEITNKFKPKIKVVIGTECAKIVGAKGGITKLNGNVINDAFILMEPQSVIINKNKLKQFQEGWMKLEELLIEQQSKMTQTIDTTKLSIPEDKIITKITNDLTLFDVKQLGDKVVYIMLDRRGIKKYLVETINFPVFVKKGNYSDCVNFPDSVDAVLMCTEQDRKTLNSKLYREINKCERM